MQQRNRQHKEMTSELIEIDNVIADINYQIQLYLDKISELRESIRELNQKRIKLVRDVKSSNLIKCPKCTGPSHYRGKSSSGERRYTCTQCHLYFGENILTAISTNDLICKCGKPINHRGVCRYRYKKRVHPEIVRSAKADCGVCPIISSTGRIDTQIACPRHGM